MNNNVKHTYTSKITGKALCCAGMLFVFAVAMLSSCTLEMSDNGHLDGYWQLTTVDTLTNGKSEDVRERLLFLSVEKDLLRLCDQGTATVDCYCRFEKTSSSLHIYNPYRNDRPNGDPPLTNPALLRIFGFESLDVTFDIEKLSSGTMILSDKHLRLHYRKR